MKKIIILITAFLSFLLFSSISYGEWTKITEDKIGDTYYLDYEKIKKHGKYVYSQYLKDYLKGNKYGDLSAKVNIQYDCNLFRYKSLRFSFYKEPMGGGTPDIDSTTDKNWTYPKLNAVSRTLLKLVCIY